MRAASVLAATVALGACTYGDNAEADDPRWNAFVDAREGYLRALAEPIRACVARNDSTEPAFHGCYDWHSAVHGTWALHAISRLTGDPAYAADADAVLDPTSINAELLRLQTTGITYELPYGYAWFLVLARERTRAGRDDLRPHAAAVSDGLAAYLAGLDPAEIAAGAVAGDYDNLSWAVVNLHAQALADGDAGRAAAMEGFARDHLLPRDECTLALERDQTAEFFPPCLHRLLALVRVLPADEAAAWLAGFVPDEVVLAPLTMPTTAHSAGLDFSRAWGLHALWRETGDPAHLHLYLDHVETWMARPAYWAMDYDNYAHWVAQFGVYAIAASFEDDA
jgi:hypothetical protein